MIDMPAARTTTAAHFLLLIRHWIHLAAARQEKQQSFIHRAWDSFWNVPPESAGQHRVYIESREWLHGTEKWLTGGLRTFAEWENVAFAVTIGRFMTLTGNNWARLGQRQLRFWLAVAAVVVIIIILKVTGH